MTIKLTTYERYTALAIKRSLGTRCAAGFLRNQGWRIEASLAFLSRK